MRALKFITGHVIFKLRYNQIYQMKNPNYCQRKTRQKLCCCFLYIHLLFLMSLRFITLFMTGKMNHIYKSDRFQAKKMGMNLLNFLNIDSIILKR